MRSGRCGGTAGPRSGRGGVGPFARVPADLSYGDRQASVWRARPSTRVARRPPGDGGALDVRALPTRERTSGSAAASVGRWDIRLGQRRLPVRGAPPLREKLVSSIARQKAKARRALSLPLSTYSALGGLPQDPGGGAESSAEATTCGNGGTTCVCCCRRMRDAVTSNQWWDRWCGCGCGCWCSARRCGGARRPTGRSGRPTRQREGSQG